MSLDSAGNKLSTCFKTPKEVLVSMRLTIMLNILKYAKYSYLLNNSTEKAVQPKFLLLTFRGLFPEKQKHI